MTTPNCSITSASPPLSRPRIAPKLTSQLEKLTAPPGFTWQRSRRAEPLGHCSLDGMAAAQARSGRRSALRPGHRTALSPRHRPDPLAPRQGSQPSAPSTSSPRAAAVGTGRAVRSLRRSRRGHQLVRRTAAALPPPQRSSVPRERHYTRTQRPAVSALRSLESSDGSHSVRSITRTRGSDASRRTAAKNSAAAIPPGRAPGAPAHRAGRSRQCRMMTSASQCATWSTRGRRRLDSLAPNIAHRHHQIAARAHRGASPHYWRSWPPDLGDIGAWETALDRRPHRIPLLSPGAASRMWKWASSMSPDLVERPADAEHRRQSHRRYCPRLAASAHAPRCSPRRPRGWARWPARCQPRSTSPRSASWVPPRARFRHHSARSA